MNLPPPRVLGKIVEYQFPLGQASVTMRVILTLPTPRVMFFSTTTLGGIEPVSMFIDDIEKYIKDAQQRI